MNENELQDYLLEKFTGKSAEYIEDNIKDVIVEYIANKVSGVDVRELLNKLNVSDIGWDIEAYLKNKGITNAGEIVTTLKRGIDGLSEIKSIYNSIKEYDKISEALADYNDTGNSISLVNATSSMMSVLSELVSKISGVGTIMSQYLDVGSGLISLGGQVLYDHYDQIGRIKEKLYEYVSAKNPKEAAKLLKDINELSTYAGYKTFVERQAVIETFENIFGSLLSEFKDYKSIIEALRNDPNCGKHMENISESMGDIKNGFKESLGSKSDSFDFDSVFNKDGTIGNVQSAIDYAGKLNQIDPLVFDLDGDGFSPAGIDTGAYFDLNGDGFRESVSWVRDNDALLAYDKNEDGIINNGNELFSNFSVLKNGKLANSGLEALKEYDDNGDGIIDENDMIFSKLRLWIDNGDGISESWELRTLKELGITCILLNGTFCTPINRKLIYSNSSINS